MDPVAEFIDPMDEWMNEVPSSMIGHVRELKPAFKVGLKGGMTQTPH